MTSADRNLRSDAQAIWSAGVAGVDAQELVKRNVLINDRTLTLGDESIDLNDVRRLIVVGAGKAGVGMVVGLESALGPDLMRELDVIGWVNVPLNTIPGNRNSGSQRIKLHAARPAGVNEPTEAGVLGTNEILRLVQNASDHDLCICLISGGGSALLPAPADGVSLADKLAITRLLSASGANIQQLNTVRIPLSRVKGGGLAAACHAAKMITLVISDVLGDPLELIASGPTVSSNITAADALRVLDDLQLREGDHEVVSRIRDILQAQTPGLTPPQNPSSGAAHNIIIGNLAVAVDAAGLEAERRGYDFAMHVSPTLEAEANDVGKQLARLALKMSSGDAPTRCLIHGGEPVVTLAEDHGLGGRNQQLVLAAYVELTSLLACASLDDALDDLVILSAGTDGEDGPTDAAGAFIDGAVHRAAQSQKLNAAAFLARNDAYHFFAATGGLIKSGPTGTNVGDLRVIVTQR